jgi:hypothetical protein
MRCAIWPMPARATRAIHVADLRLCPRPAQFSLLERVLTTDRVAAHLCALRPRRIDGT